jgi:pilus assembly protein FimV
MLKKSAVIAALFFTTVSSNLYALGLGAIDMQSGLNQPMNAVIDLTSASGTDLSEIKISIASKEAHDRTGLSKHRILSDFKFSVEQDDRGNAFVRVTSTDTVHEPFLEFLLELQWSNGRLLREYTVLVDPPVTMPAAPVTPVAPVSRAPAPVAQAPVRQSRPATSRSTTTPVRTAAAPASSADSYGPVRRNETLWNIARRTRPGNDITVDQMMHALLRENPRAFVNNNINRLKAGVTLNIPDRASITAITASEAIAESRRQTQEWQDGQTAPAQETAPVASSDSDVAVPEVAPDARLQLTAPEDEAVAGAATASAGDPQAAEGQTASDVGKQLALATEEAEASKAETQELQSRVNDLENQIETMKRLLELKDDALAGMQDQVASDGQAEMPEIDEPEVPQESDVIEIEMDEQAAAEVEDVIEPEAGIAQVAEPEAVDEPRGIVNKLMDNPVLAGLGVLVAMLLGGFLWASTRQKSHQSIFDDEMTLEKHMASSSAKRSEAQAPVVDFEEEIAPEEETTSIEGHDESDPITEADVYLAYGRIQQAQDVLQAALENAPSDNNLRIKLLEVYHAGGNISAFDREASDFRDTVNEDDPQWLRVATMGFALSPGNDLYHAAAVDGEGMTDPDFDMDLSGMDENEGGNDAEDAKPELPESIEFNLDDEMHEIIEDDQDASEGLLNNADEIATKLDLARAYMDMGDPEGARSILDEVMGEGNDDQKREAEEIISQLG